MANLRRHFNFNGKQSLSQDPFSLSSSKLPYNNFDKITLMNDICNCLDLCCSYVQALNSLCSAGSSLARNLFYTVREAPAYQNISLQFLAVWDEVSKATAGASAAVKTETLMLLQEVLNSLEVSSNEANVDEIILNSFQAIGSCICSFIELQAQFSWSTWKSLSKLSKTFSSDPLKPSLSLQWKSFEKNPFKNCANADLNSTIKKHYSQLFCKVGVPKMNESPGASDRQFHSQTVPSKANVSTFQFTPEKNQHNASAESLWSSTIWSSKNYTGSSPQTDLDEVINLLSCVPVQQFTDNIRNKNLVSYPLNREQINNTISEDSPSSIPGQLQNHQAWSKNTDNVQNDSIYWHLNDPSLSINSGANRSHMYENPEFFKHWEYNDIQMWNASSTETNSSSDDVSSHCLDADAFSSDKHKLYNNIINTSFKRGSQSGESMPGGLENVSEYGESPVELQSKINTWPLKQTINQEF